jgi:hypothetical protein
LKVSTLISADFKVGSSRIAAFTLVVMTLSSKYCPVLSCVGVDEQAPSVANAVAANNASKKLVRFSSFHDLILQMNFKIDSFQQCAVMHISQTFCTIFISLLDCR